MPGKSSTQKRYFVDYLKWRGRPVKVAEIVAAFELYPEDPHLAASQAPFDGRRAAEGRARWNSANRSLNNLVKQGDLVKVSTGKGTQGVLFGFPFDQFRFRHHYKTLALDQLAHQYLSEIQYRKMKDSGATAKDFINAIQGPAGLSPETVTVVLAALVNSLDRGDGNVQPA